MKKVRLATIWLDGCSGCHMSFLDMDERLLEIGQRADLVHSPLVDRKDYPEDVDVCLVEGAVSSEEDLEKIAPESASSALFIRSILPGTSSPARLATPISVPVASNSSTRKNTSTTLRMPAENAPGMSSARKVGAIDGGAEKMP